MGDILDIIREDVVEIITEGGFETDITLTSPSSVVIQTKGLAVRRTDVLEYDDGSKKNSPFSSITIPFSSISTTDTYITLKGWTASFTDSEKTLSYTIDECLPNRTLGIINCTLKDG